MKGQRYTLSAYGLMAPFSASGSIFGLTLPHPCVLQEWRQSVFINAPSDASNYWSIALNSISGTLATFTTASLTAGVWNLKVMPNLAKAIADSAVAVYVFATKVGSPGNLNAIAGVIYVE